MQTIITSRRGVPKPRVMPSRDAVISFQCLSTDLIRVSESFCGQYIHHPIVQRNSDVVTEMDQKYIFFADEANIARKLIACGRSCVLSVYFREL
jgi:hypothetical protein